MIETIVGIVFGALITLGVSHWYYKRAGEELQNEAAELRKLATMMLTAMELQGWVKLNRNSKGEIAGFVFEHIASGGLRLGGSTDAKFISTHPDDVRPNDASPSA